MDPYTREKNIAHLLTVRRSNNLGYCDPREVRRNAASRRARSLACCPPVAPTLPLPAAAATAAANPIFCGAPSGVPLCPGGPISFRGGGGGGGGGGVEGGGATAVVFCGGGGGGGGGTGDGNNPRAATAAASASSTPLDDPGGGEKRTLMPPKRPRDAAPFPAEKVKPGHLKPKGSRRRRRR